MSERHVLSDRDAGETLTAAEVAGTAAERRRWKRRAFSAVQFMAPYDGTHLPTKAAFRQVQCNDLSPAGISFLLPSRPESKYVVVALGKPPRVSYTTAQVIYCRRKARGFLVGCKFLAKVELPS
jgi:hypothetical protein